MKKVLDSFTIRTSSGAGSKALAWYGPDPELINRDLQCYKLSLMLSSAVPGINDDPVRFRREGGSIPQ